MNLSTACNSVAARFGAAAATYDAQARIQRVVAEKLMATVVDFRPVDRILEVGCGTGTLTEMLCRRFPDASIHAVDIAEPMVEHARARLGEPRRIRWYVTDARRFRSCETFPLIISSSALHWMVPVADTIKRFESLLEPGGSFISALMVSGTFPELQAARRRAAPDKPAPVSLPRAEEVLEAAQSAGLTVLHTCEEFLQAGYDSANTFLRSLNEQGVTGTADGGGSRLNRTELREVIGDYDRCYAARSGGVYATFRVLYIHAVKGGKG